MPWKGGIETLRDILAMDVQARVFRYSGRPGGGEHNGTATVLGALNTFEKPFRIVGLLEPISTCLSGRLTAV